MSSQKDYVYDEDRGRNGCAPHTTWGMKPETIIEEYSNKIDPNHSNSKILNALSEVIVSKAQKEKDSLGGKK
tara:strand:- start:61 stop:276 length:216 start_codon:yes stop_codon:yes gene_type:complete